jgi:hypothetical protein
MSENQFFQIDNLDSSSKYDSYDSKAIMTIQNEADINDQQGFTFLQKEYKFIDKSD